MSDTRGHFTIGDLNFSFDGDLKELAHCQEIIREIRQAEYRLQRVADSDKVYLIYDQDLEGERGTFDKMRLRCYDDEHTYTLDIGVTDTNPLGIYVGHDQNVRVYHRERGESWEVDDDGNRVSEQGDTQRERPDPEGQGRSKAQGQDRSQPSSRSSQEPKETTLDVVQEDRELVAEAAQKQDQGKAGTAIGEARAKIITQTMQRSDLQKQEIRSLCENFGIERVADLTFSQVKEAYRYAKRLAEFADDLPY